MRIGTIPEMRQPSPAGKPYRPPNSLLPQHGTVEAISKVLGVLCLDYARDFDNYTTAMTNQHWCFRRLALLCTVALHARYYSINQCCDVDAPHPFNLRFHKQKLKTRFHSFCRRHPSSPFKTNLTVSHRPYHKGPILPPLDISMRHVHEISCPQMPPVRADLKAAADLTPNSRNRRLA